MIYKNLKGLCVSMTLLLGILLNPILTPTVYAQTFALANSSLQVAAGYTQWGDYDGDGDLDLFVTGSINFTSGTTFKIYRNDNGSFTDINASLPSVNDQSGNVEWGDYDKDGDLDLLLMGEDDNSDPFTRVYRNDNGTFTNASVGLISLFFGRAVWGDYDGDDDLDILMTGSDNNFDSVTKVYRNNGNGTFTDIMATITTVQFGAAAWVDYDNDGDLDAFVSGYTDENFSAQTAEIFKNTNGSFSDANVGLSFLEGGDVDFGDYDNDGDLDLLQTGTSNTGDIKTILYQNNGGSYTDVSNSAIPSDLRDINGSSVEWGDYDSDGDLDIVIRS